MSNEKSEKSEKTENIIETKKDEKPIPKTEPKTEPETEPKTEPKKDEKTEPPEAIDLMGANILDEVVDDMNDLNEELNINEFDFSIHKDKNGDGFNSDIHKTDDNGKPLFQTDGKTLKMKRGRKKGSVLHPKTAPENPDIAEHLSSNMLAKFTVSNFTGICVGVFGDEWYPVENEKENERKLLEDTFANYYASQNIADIPPGVALTIGLISYGSRRLNMPKTKSKISVWKKGVSYLLAKFKGGFSFRKKKNQAPEKQAEKKTENEKEKPVEVFNPVGRIDM